MIVCILPSDYFVAGETAVCLLRGLDECVLYNKSIVFAQVHGHMNIDFRWFQSSKKLQDYFIEPSPLVSIDKVQKPGRDPSMAVSSSASSTNTSFCIFASSRVALSPTTIFEGGTIVEFQLPSNLLPSFRGLCGTINYFVTLTVQHAVSKETFDFPISVRGRGSLSTPYPVSHVSIVGYAASLLPKESLFSAGHQMAPPSRPSGDTLYTEHQELLELPKVYAIRDVDYICSVCIKSYTVVVGDDASILLDFAGNIQACSAVRSTVTLSEQRADGTIIQEKMVTKSIKSARHAQLLHLSIHIPDECIGSLDTPLFKGAGSNNSSSASFESAFSFSVPIEVLVKRQLLIHPSNILGGKLTHDATETTEHTQKCMSSAEYVQQRIIECLDSDIVSYPLQCRSK